MNTMDFHALARKDLQFLCKKNCIQANQTNVAMANSLQDLETVEGIEEIQKALGLQSPKKAVAKPSPDLSRTTGRISARRATHGDEPKNQHQSPLPRSRQVKGKALEVTFKASKDADGEKTEPPKVYPKTPVTRKTGKGAEASRSRIRAKKEQEEEGTGETTPKTVETEKGKANAAVPRRSARLSSWKPVEETATVQSKSRRSTRAKKVVNKMGFLGGEEVDEKEMVKEKNDLVPKADEEAAEKDQKVESHGSSSSLGRGSSKAKADVDSHLLLANELLEYSSDELPENEPMEDPGDRPREKEKVDFSGDQIAGNDVVKDSSHPSGSNKLQEETDSCCVEVEKEKLGLFSEITLKNWPPEAGVAQDASSTTIAAHISKEIDESTDLAPDSKSEALIREIAVEFSVQAEDNLPEAGELAPKEPIEVQQKTEISPGATLEVEKFSVKDSPIEFTEESVEDEVQNAGKITTNESVTFQGASFELQVPVSSAVSVIEPEEAGADLLSKLATDDGSVDVPKKTETSPSGSFELQIPAVSVGILTKLKTSELAGEESANMAALQEWDVQNKIPEEEDIIHADMAAAAIATFSSPDEKVPDDSGDLSILQTPLVNSEEAEMTVTEKVEEKMEIKSVEKENALAVTETVEEEETKSMEKDNVLAFTEKDEEGEEIKSEEYSLAATETVEEEEIIATETAEEKEEIKSGEKKNFLAVVSETAEEEEIKSAEKEISLAATETVKEKEEIKSAEKDISWAATETVEEKGESKSVEKDNPLAATETTEEEEIKSMDKDNFHAATSTDTVEEKEEIKEENLESLSLGQLRAIYKQKLEDAKNKNKVKEKKSIINQEEVLDLEFSGSIKLDDANSIKKKLNQEKIKPERKIFVIKQEDIACLSQSKSDSNCKKILHDDKIITSNKSEIKRTPLKNLN